MASFEMWSCDWHADPPEGDGDVVNEDQARDERWVRVERDTTVTLARGSTWPSTEVNHVCAECLKDAECVAWLRDGGFRGFYEEDRERLAEVMEEDARV